MINPTFFWRSLKGRCYDNQFVARIGENWHTPTHFRSVRWHFTTDGMIATWMRALTPPMTRLFATNLVTFGPVATEFSQARLCRAGYTLGFIVWCTFCTGLWYRPATTWCTNSVKCSVDWTERLWTWTGSGVAIEQRGAKNSALVWACLTLAFWLFVLAIMGATRCWKVGRGSSRSLVSNLVTRACNPK